MKTRPSTRSEYLLPLPEKCTKTSALYQNKNKKCTPLYIRINSFPSHLITYYYIGFYYFCPFEYTYAGNGHSNKPAGKKSVVKTRCKPKLFEYNLTRQLNLGKTAVISLIKDYK